jgi:hypothetical protein
MSWRNLKTTELISDLSEKNKERSPDKNYPISGEQLIRTYIEWQIEIDAFAYVLVTNNLKSGILLPLICASSDYLVANISDVLQRGKKGFELLFSSRTTAQEHKAFFARFEYEIGSERTTDAWDSPLISAAWNKDRFRAALRAALSLGGCTFCSFGHDADPVYLLEFCTQHAGARIDRSVNGL